MEVLAVDPIESRLLLQYNSQNRVAVCFSIHDIARPHADFNLHW